MLRLLKHIETMSCCRDRETLGASAVVAIHEVLNPCHADLMRVVTTADGSATALVARIDDYGLRVNDNEAIETAEPIDSQALLRRCYRECQPVFEEHGDRFTYAYPLIGPNNSSPSGFLRLETQRKPTVDEDEAIIRFLQFYCNYLNLLDYSELDTLTGLLNRKTFDGVFDRMLTHSSNTADHAPDHEERRSNSKEGNQHWLAVMDIDHFKRVNDTFGHLFGDEVLLRVANLMRNAFRSEDRLFRFGGEEFIALLHVGSRDHAYQVLERLREQVEQNEFPQVGKVTCSIGFTVVDPQLAPTDIVGRADEALYYAKEHGRNKVSCYETLIEEGLLVRQTIGSQQPEIDIDTLFS